MPITALRVTPPSSLAIWLALLPSDHMDFEGLHTFVGPGHFGHAPFGRELARWAARAAGMLAAAPVQGRRQPIPAGGGAASAGRKLTCAGPLRHKGASPLAAAVGRLHGALGVAVIPPVLPTYARAPLSFVEGEGAWLTEAGGERYLDLGGGIAVTALGHAHPALVAALEAQARKLWHTSNLYQIPNQEALAERLVAATFADTVFVTNSGTEAIECAIKMARKHFDAQGRSRSGTASSPSRARSTAGATAAISAAGSEKMVKGFGPVVPGFDHVPFGDLAAVESAIRPETAAVLIEPIQGEGGIRVLPPRGPARAAGALRRARAPAHPRRDPVRHGADRPALRPRVGRDHARTS